MALERGSEDFADRNRLSLDFMRQVIVCRNREAIVTDAANRGLETVESLDANVETAAIRAIRRFCGRFGHECDVRDSPPRS